MDKKLLTKLGEKRLAIEKELAKKTTDLKALGDKYNYLEDAIRKLKTERLNLGRDISLVCSNQEPRFSSGYKKPKERKKNAKEKQA